MRYFKNYRTVSSLEELHSLGILWNKVYEWPWLMVISRLTSGDRRRRVDTVTAKRESARLHEVRVSVLDRRWSGVSLGFGLDGRVEQRRHGSRAEGRASGDRQSRNTMWLLDVIWTLFCYGLCYKIIKLAYQPVLLHGLIRNTIKIKLIVNDYNYYLTPSFIN